jgi:N-acetyl sugar amidotransferase
VERSRFQDYCPRPVDQHIVVGYIGTFRGATAIRALVDAIGLARQRGIPAEGFFAGTGPDLPLVQHLCARCDYLRYDGAFDQSRDISRLYGQVNMVYAVYDDTEDKRIHWAIRLGESVFARVPITVMSGSFMAELVAKHGLGFEVPLGDALSIADVIERMWRNRSSFREIAARCERAEPIFAFETYEAEFLAAYRAILGRGAICRTENVAVATRGTSRESDRPVSGHEEVFESYRVCSHCVMDTSDSGITFDERGVCDHCKDYYSHVEPNWHTDERGRLELEATVAKIKDSGKRHDFDCLLGLSGGVDSSYMLHLAVKEFGLRPLVFHVDGGWNSELAVHNINVMIDKLGLDLYTEVINWEEMRDFQLAFFKSGVPHIDIPQDHAFIATLYNFADKHGIKYILNGGNIATECVRNPMEWMYYGTDMAQIRDIRKRFSTRGMDTYPFSSVLRHKFYLRYIRGVKVVKLLNYRPYVKADALKLLSDVYDWKPYPQKHFESRFTKFYEGYWMPERFGFDTRRVQYSSLIITGQMARDDALKRLEVPAYDPATIDDEFDYIATKLGISSDELRVYFTMPKKFYWDYKNQVSLFKLGAHVLKAIGVERSIKR